MERQTRSLDNMVGALFLDVAGTLFHISAKEEHLELIDLGNERKIHPQTRDLLARIRDEGVMVALVTGMRSTSYNRIRDQIPHDYGIIEHGGIIVREGNQDAEWSETLKDQVVAVQSYKFIMQRSLPSSVLDDKDRLTSFRLIPDLEEGYDTIKLIEILHHHGRYIPEDRQKMTEVLIATPEYSQTFEVPVFKGVRMFLHVPYPPPYGCIEIIPENSGKGNAIKFIAKRHGICSEKIAAFGDDLNDLEMIEAAHYGFTFMNVKEPVREVVSNRSGGAYITNYSTHRGTIDVLTHFLEEVVPQMKES